MMQYFDVKKILDHYNIYYEERPNSSDLDILCPFHDDHHLGSAKFNVDTGLFNCYSCKAHGNVFQFVAQLEGISVKEAGELIENDFEPKGVYDLDRLKNKVTKIRVLDEAGEYLKTAKKIALKILHELATINPTVDFVYRWWVIIMWMLKTPKQNISNKNKQVINLYAMFIKEKEMYNEKNTTNRT